MPQHVHITRKPIIAVIQKLEQAQALMDAGVLPTKQVAEAIQTLQDQLAKARAGDR